MQAKRTVEICEAIQLLHDLNKTPELIARQVELTVPEVRAVLMTGRIPVKQKTLFENKTEPQKERPESRLAPWVQALRE